MNYRRLGQSELEVSRICLGGNVFGWTIDEQTSFQLLDAFVDAGFNFIDTADVYSAWAHGGTGGQSETIIGKWLATSGKRDKVILATKAGMEMGPDKKGLSKAYLQQAIEDSLRRLQTDYVDLYQAHKDDASVPLDETLSAYTDMIRQGKVRAIGASNYCGGRLREAVETSKKNGLARYVSLQPLYNLYDRADFENELKAVCEKEHLGVIPYYSLAAGFLTGKYRSAADAAGKARGGTVQKYLNNRGWAILRALDDVSGRIGATPAEVSLAWLIARPAVTAPIASATSLDQLKTLTRAAEIKLDFPALETLNQASAVGNPVAAKA